MDDAVWNHAVFSKNRDRLLTADVANFNKFLEPSVHNTAYSVPISGQLLVGEYQPGGQ